MIKGIIYHGDLDQKNCSYISINDNDNIDILIRAISEMYNVDNKYIEYDHIYITKNVFKDYIYINIESMSEYEKSKFFNIYNAMFNNYAYYDNPKKICIAQLEYD